MFIQRTGLANFCRAFGGIRANGITLEQAAISIARQYGGALLYARDNLSNLFQNSNGTGAVTGTNQPIGLWQDSAMSFNASQATSANKPLLTTINGNFAISTNGTNQLMTISNPPQIAGDFTVVWAGNVGNLSTNRLLLSGNTANRLGLEVTTSGAVSVYGVGGLVASSGAGYVTTASAVYSIRRTSSGLEFRRNGVVFSTVSGTFTFAAVTTMHLYTNGTLSSAFFLGNTAKLFIATQAVPDADLLQIERFGAQRLGITL